ncbi:MAG: Alanine--tRNA ligase [Candidatus Heimdallarchaeota archaeon LC_2]|nr:MAG: Alanine--tRNA ligase [Candidatus Heimdallarchaeota archaeon LC_2]
MEKSELAKIFTPEQYNVELFKEKGHSRKQCSNCGLFFWTLSSERQTCGDTSCEGGYKFIGRKGPNWNFHQTISQLTNFFEKNGHEPIDPYPVVARWRDDLDFTIASIADFQPWVTSGQIPPPANPLTVPQPCLRFGGEFSDIDNVGRTGRHLTSFVMFGQHAFVSENIKGGYWMDHCIDLNFKFLTTKLGLEAEEITYVENIWMGGGNFGPNLESMAYGAEIVNSVFMQYENTPTGYKEMDLKVIDVGWGTERTSWFSQGTPTIYEATYGPVLDYLLKQTGIKVNQELLRNYSKIAGLIDINEVSDVKKARLGIAEQLGYSLKDLNTELQEIEAIYAIGDHSRTLAFALSDGAIPSNVGGGYNIRTMIRRLFTLNEIYNFNLDLHDIIERTAIYVSQSFPRVKESIAISETILDVERTRYDKTVATGRKHIKQLMKSKKKIDDKLLVELYSSRGIPPETVVSIAKDEGVNISIPMDFYQQADQATDKKKEDVVVEEIDLAKIKSLVTEQLYYDKNLKKVSEAFVLEVLDSGHIILDKTIFYPIGGGQAEDHGFMHVKGMKLEVIDVKKFGTAIVHKVDRLPDKLVKGTKVKLELDLERRLALMRHHTAVHIVGGAAREVLGNHIWQAGADKTPDRGRLDITHWEGISRETLDEIEYVANSVVMDNRRIEKHIMERTDAESKFGFTIYQGGVVPGKELRIVEIPGIDVEACGGTHANMTGDIGYIRILGAERIQDGIVRITLTAGNQAVERVQHDYQLLSESSAEFSVNPEELPATTKRFFSEWKEQGKQITNLSKQLAEAKVPLLIQSAKKITSKSGNEISLVVNSLNAPQSDLINLGEKFSELSQKEGNLIAIIIGENEGRAMVVVARSKGSKISLSPVIKNIGKLLGGGGGGSGDVVSGGGTKIAGISEALKQAKKIVSESV